MTSIVQPVFDDMTDALPNRIERIELEDWLTRLRSLEQLPGNPQGIQIRQFGEATGMITRGAPDNVMLNRVMLLGDEDVHTGSTRLLPGTKQQRFDGVLT